MNIQEIGCWSDLSIDRTGSGLVLSQDFDKVKHDLDTEHKNALVDLIYPVAVSAFNVNPSDVFYKDVEEHIFDADILVVSILNNRVSGFASVRKMDQLDTMFIHGIAVCRTAQNRGVASSILGKLIKESKYSRIAFTTQNPIMFCLLQKKVTRCFPTPCNPEVSSREWDFGQQIMRLRRGVFDPKTFVSKDLYDQCLYPEINLTNDPSVNSWFKEKLEIVSGQTRNGFLLCGEIS